MNQADRWLHGELRALRGWRGDWPEDAVTEKLEKSLAGLAALESAGVLDTASTAMWQQRFEEEARGDRRSGPASPDLAARADTFLANQLELLQRDPEWNDAHVQRFEAAVHLLSSAGAVDGRVWNARFREREGWPTEEEERAEERTLNAGGTEVELLDVMTGPDHVRQGYRLMLVLRFADGVSFVIDKNPAEVPDVEWPDWDLTDDLGTHYWGGGFGGSDEDEHCSFRTPVPDAASWLQLTLVDHPDIAFRVHLV